jgi:branched-chain amino acid transport system substrate-binding protein
MRKLWTAVGTILVVLALVLCCAKKEPQEIKIGWIGVLTGDYAYYGQTVKKGTELAVQEINATDGINSKRLVVIYEDDQLQPKIGIAAFTKFATEKIPVVIQAAGSSVMLAEAPIAEENKIVLISPTCSSDKLKDAGDYIFRNFPSDSYQGAVIAKFVFNQLKISTTAIFYINNDAGVGLKNIFQEDFTKMGGTIVESQSFEPESKDFRTQLIKIKDANPKIIFLPSHVREAAIILKQAKELGIKIPFIGTDGCYSPDLVKLAGNAAEGFYVSNLAWSVEDKDPLVQNFVERFRKEFNEDPSAYAAAAYDCIKIIAKAIEIGGASGPKIKDALYTIRDFPGVTGPTTFDQWGEVSKPYNIYVVKNSKFELFAEKVM